MQHNRGAVWDIPGEEEAETVTLDTIESLVPSDVLQQPVLRSRPIAIRQSANREDNNDDSDDSSHRDEDAEEGDAPFRTNAMPLSQRQQQHQSLPSRWLLRAPLLGSVPTNEDFMRRHGTIPEFRLPEPDTVAGDDTAEKETAYGSLRDSHMQGRFLDPPRTGSSIMGGDERVMAHRRGASGSTGNTMSSSAPIFSGLTIGERIQQQRKLQIALSSKNSGGVTAVGQRFSSVAEATTTAIPRKSSVLAELLGKMELEAETGAADPSTTTTIPPDVAHHVGFESRMDDTPVLSSSVTGLAILQGGLQPPDQRWTALQKHRSLPPTISNSQVVSSSTNARLSQSFTSPPSTDSHFYDTVPDAVGFLLPPVRTASTNAFGYGSSVEPTMYSTSMPFPPTAPFESQMLDLPIPPVPPSYLPPFSMDSPMALEEGVDDPDDQSDLEGAFDLDMD